MTKVQTGYYQAWRGTEIQDTYNSNTVLDTIIEYATVDTSGGPVQITLPDATDVEIVNGKTIWIIDSGSAATNSITLIPNPSDTTDIDGDTSLVINADDAIAILELVDGVWTVLNRGAKGLDNLNIASISTTYTADVEDDVIFADTTGGAFTITLSPLATARDKPLHIKKIRGAAPLLTIDADGIETIEGDLDLRIAGAGGSAVALQPRNSTDWSIMP